MRLFIAINLPEETKRIIGQTMDKIQFTPSNASGPLLTGRPRFLSPKNWHLTITFLGYQPDEAVGPILESIKETAAGFEPIEIDFESIIYGPPGNAARMVWLTGSKETSRTLSELKLRLEETLVENGVRFKRENRAFNAHLTLVRFSEPLGKLSDHFIAKLPLSFEAKSLDLMESHLQRSGADYEPLSKFAFK